MDLHILQFLAAPAVASLVIAGIHAYLGLHVVERGVIFVDLSLAQIASLGATIAAVVPALGGDPNSRGVYWMSLGFTLIGALIFSMIRGRRARRNTSRTCSSATFSPCSGRKCGRRARCIC